MKKFAELSLCLCVLAITACTSASSSIDDADKKTSAAAAATDTQEEAAESGTQEEAAESGTQEAAAEATETAGADDVFASARIIKREGAVKNRGVYIKILVNRNPVTNHDISRRTAFLKLRQVPGNKAKKAEEEMIEQILKLQEAVRTNTLASDAMVEKAFANFARNNRTTKAQMSQAMNEYGVGTSHFREYIRTQISWQRTVAGRFQAQTTQVSERDAVLKLRSSGSEKPELTEYSFQQIVFVVPGNRRSKSLLRTRRAEANAFRRQFTTCGETLVQAKRLKDVSVITRKRILEPELPARWADEVKNLDSKGTTRVLETDRGIEMLAICEEKQVSDDRAAQISTQSAEYNSFEDRGSEFSKQYLDELKSRATIIYQ